MATPGHWGLLGARTHRHQGKRNRRQGSNLPKHPWVHLGSPSHSYRVRHQSSIRGRAQNRLPDHRIWHGHPPPLAPPNLISIHLAAHWQGPPRKLAPPHRRIGLPLVPLRIHTPGRQPHHIPLPPHRQQRIGHMRGTGQALVDSR